MTHSALAGFARAFYTTVNAQKGDLSHEDISNLLISALITSVNIAAGESFLPLSPSLPIDPSFSLLAVAANTTDFYIDNEAVARELNRISVNDEPGADQRIAVSAFSCSAFTQR